MKFLKDPKKDYFITTPEIDNFSKLHMGMEEYVLVSSIKAGKSICEHKKSQKQIQFTLTFGSKIKTEFKNKKSLKPPPCQVQLDYKFYGEE